MFRNDRPLMNAIDRQGNHREARTGLANAELAWTASVSGLACAPLMFHVMHLSVCADAAPETGTNRHLAHPDHGAGEVECGYQGSHCLAPEFVWNRKLNMVLWLVDMGVAEFRRGALGDFTKTGCRHARTIPSQSPDQYMMRPRQPKYQKLFVTSRRQCRTSSSFHHRTQ